MSEPALVDWPLLLNILRARAGSLDAIAPRCRMTGATLRRLARGDVAQPRFDQGVRLLDIAAEHLQAADWQRVRMASLLTKKRSQQ